MVNKFILFVSLNHSTSVTKTTNMVMIGGSIMRNMKCKLKNNIFREKVCIFNFKQSFQNWMKRSLRAVELHVEMVL